jgi:hypothetical protein
LTSRLQSFETALLTQADNLAGLATLNRELIARAQTIDSFGGWCWIWTAPRSRSMASRSRAPTMDTSSPPVITRCCDSMARETVSLPSCAPATSTTPRAELLLAEIEGQQQHSKEVVFRADAAFAKPEIYEALEERDVKDAIRIPAANDNLQRNITELLSRSVPNRWFSSRASFIRRPVGTRRGGWWRRSSSTSGNCSTAWALSWPTLPRRAARWRAFTANGHAEQWIKEGKGR